MDCSHERRVALTKHAIGLQAIQRGVAGASDRVIETTTDVAAKLVPRIQNVLCSNDLTPVILQLKKAFAASLHGEDFPSGSRIFYHSGKLCEALSTLCRFPLLRKCLLQAGMMDLVGVYLKCSTDSTHRAPDYINQAITQGFVETENVKTIVKSILTLTTEEDEMVTKSLSQLHVRYSFSKSKKLVDCIAVDSDTNFDVFAIQTLWTLALYEDP